MFGQVSSGQKDGGLSAAVMCSAVMCPAAKWVDTVLGNSSKGLWKSRREPLKRHRHAARVTWRR